MERRVLVTNGSARLRNGLATRSKQANLIAFAGASMNDQQWNTLVAAVRGETLRPLPTAFIIDSPWLPNWAGHTILDYFTDDRIYLDDNLKAIRTFPETIFLPGFWSEYGMCTEPSAFGSVSMFGEDEFPFAKKVLHAPSEVDRLEKPDPRKHGLLPFVIKRLQHLQPQIEAAGHKIRFAVARGPLNIASFLMGTPEFLEATKTDPERMHRLLDIVTGFPRGLDGLPARSLPHHRRHHDARRHRRLHQPPRLRGVRPALSPAHLQRRRDGEVLP
ncbi:MAG TPA: uroporphyrinogen decarboxylase family protein [Acidobacteriaceae bacterium]|nr:uroporphyrinogen decarboxylase family protein [Acidobacteriaceae bacterium]